MEQAEKFAKALVNEISELVYIADPQTYELYYMNDAGRRTFQVGAIHPGLKCYQVLQGLDAPCSFCTNDRLDCKQYYTWTYTNPLTGRHYVLKDRLVDWNGKTARMEIAFDVTESEREKVELKHALDSQAVLLECVRELYQEVETSYTIPHILKRLGEFLGAERAYIFTVHDKSMSNTFEWCRAGIAPQLEKLQNLDSSLTDPWKAALTQGKCFVLYDIEKTHQTGDSALYEILKMQNIHSLAAAPMEQDGALIGWLGVDNPPMERLKNISTLLHTLCYFLMLALRRDADKQALIRMGYTDKLTGLLNRNRYIADLENPQVGCVGVVYLDINGLKDINDLYGHEYGDSILVSCAKMIVSVFPDDQLYRIGGDEFVILCRTAGRDDFYALVQKLICQFDACGKCCAAIGYHWAESSDALQAGICIADNAMYKDKKAYYHRCGASNRYRHQSDGSLAP